MLNHLHLFLLVSSVVIFTTVIIITLLLHRQSESWNQKKNLADSQVFADVDKEPSLSDGADNAESVPDQGFK